MSDEEPEQIRKLFIGGLSYQTTEDSLSKFFSQWGELTDCVVMSDPATKRSRGFGFVTFQKAGMVDDCMSCRPHKLDGREVEAKRAVSREESNKPGVHKSVKRLFLGGIKESVTEEDIRNYFSSYGNVESVDMLTDKNTGKKRGFGFVNFDDYDIVDKVIQTKRHMIGGVSIEVRKALPKDELAQEKRGYNGYGMSWGWDGYGYWAHGNMGGFRGNRGQMGRGMRGRGNGRGGGGHYYNYPGQGGRGGYFPDGGWGRSAGAQSNGHSAVNGAGMSGGYVNGGYGAGCGYVGGGGYGDNSGYGYGPQGGWAGPHGNWGQNQNVPQGNWSQDKTNYWSNGWGNSKDSKRGGGGGRGNGGGGMGQRGNGAVGRGGNGNRGKNRGGGIGGVVAGQIGSSGGMNFAPNDYSA